MLTINQSIQNFLKKHHKQRIQAAIAGLLSLVVAFSVCGSLIMPAISMTKSEEQAVSELNLAEDHIALMGAGIPTAFQEPPENATNFESVITKFTVTPENLETVDGSTKKGNFNVTYNFTTDSHVSPSQPYIYYILPDNVNVPTTYAGETCTVLDATDGWREWQKRNNKDVSVTSGYYSIDPESHLVVIQFTEDYCTYIREKNGIFEGTLNFEGQVKRADTIDGDQTIIANGHEIHVAFDDAPATIDKSCSIDTGAKVIRWTVVLKNPGSTKDGQFTGYTDLTKCTLEDLELPDNVQTNPDGMGSVSNHQFTFSEAANHQETITFTYERALTEAELSSGSVTNTATLKDENQQTISQDTENAKFATSKSILSKSGTPSYAVDGSKGFILWTIQVDRGYGMSLKDYVLADDAWKGEYSDLTAVDRNGQTVALTIDKTTEQQLLTERPIRLPLPTKHRRRRMELFPMKQPLPHRAVRLRMMRKQPTSPMTPQTCLM